QKVHRSGLPPGGPPIKKSGCFGQTLSQNKYSTGVKTGVTRLRALIGHVATQPLTANFWRLDDAVKAASSRRTPKRALQSKPMKEDYLMEPISLGWLRNSMVRVGARPK